MHLLSKYSQFSVYVAGLDDRGIKFRSPGWNKKILSSQKASKLALDPPNLPPSSPIHWVTRYVFPDVECPGHETGKLHLVLTLKISVTLLPLSHIGLSPAEEKLKFLNYYNLALVAKH